MRDTPLRSAVKAATWRAIATLTTMVLVFAFTRRLFFALGIGALEVICKLVLYYSHERFWNLVRWGKAQAGKEATREQSASDQVLEENVQFQPPPGRDAEIPEWAIGKSSTTIRQT